MKLKKVSLAVATAFASFQSRFGFAPNAVAISLDKEAHGKLPKDQQALYVEKDGKFVLDLPEGVEEVGGLKSALKKERDAREAAEKARKEFEKKYEGIDPDQVRALLEKMGTDEEGKLLKDGKIDEVVARRMSKAQAAHEKALKAANDAVAQANAKAEKFMQRVLDNHVRAAASKAGLHPHAIEDALFRARTIFKLDDEGNAVQFDGDKVVIGKDGKSPFSPDEWLTGMKETAPHWFPSSNSGSGAGGNSKGGSAGAKQMKRADFDKLDPMAKAQTVKDKVAIVD